MSFISKLAGRFRNSVPDYEAAGLGRRGKLWTPSNAGPNVVLTGNLDLMRSRARAEMRNNPYAYSGKTSLVSNIVGTGIKPLFTTPDAGFNREAGQLWDDWTAESDADGLIDYYGQQAMAVGAMIESGEAFIRLRTRRPVDGLAVPLQIQVLEADYCPVNKTGATPDGGVIRNGIEFSAIGQRAAYWMYRNHPGDRSGLESTDLTETRVPASEVAHIYDAIFRRPGLIRGEPWLVRALVKLQTLHQYDAAEVERKKTAAMFAGFIRRPMPEGLDAEGMLEMWGDTGEITSSGVGQVGLEPGTMQVLAAGEELEFSQPADVGGSYEPFMRAQLRAISVAMGVLYEQLTGDYSQINDRTYRAAVNEFRRQVGIYQHSVVAQMLCRPVHRRWVDLAVLSGALTPPRSLQGRDLYRVKWVPQGFSYIHPVQEVQAAKEAVRNGFKSRDEVIAEMGYDAEAIDAEIARGNARADAAGLVFDSDARHDKAAALAAAAQPTDDETDETEGVTV
jgi:lambda family phage portal protein